MAYFKYRTNYNEVISLFQFDTRLLTFKHISWSKIERCEKRAFQLHKMRKMNIS